MNQYFEEIQINGHSSSLADVKMTSFSVTAKGDENGFCYISLQPSSTSEAGKGTIFVRAEDTHNHWYWWVVGAASLLVVVALITSFVLWKRSRRYHVVR